MRRRSITKVVLANGMRTQLFSDQAAPQTIGGVDAAHVISMHARGESDVWEAGLGSVFHITSATSGVGRCLTTDSVCSKAFVWGVFHDGQTLWAATGGERIAASSDGTISVIKDGKLYRRRP